MKKLESWDLEKHGISPSGMQLFLECREQFRLAHVENLTAKHTKDYFDFGNAVHYVFAHYYDLDAEGVRRFGDKDIAITKWIDKKLDDFVAKSGEVRVRNTPDARQQLEVTMGQAFAVLYGYFKRWRKEDEKMTVIEAEQKRSIVVEVDKRKVKLNGTLDLDCLDGKGNEWIFDTKCKSQIIENNVEEGFTYDLQFLWYMVMAYRLGKKPKGVRYNGIRRPSSKPRKDEKLKAYIDRLRVETVKKPDHFFFRFRAEFTRKEVERWYETQLVPMLRMLIMWVDGRLPHFVTPGALIRNNSRSVYYNKIVHGDGFDLIKGAHWNRYR